MEIRHLDALLAITEAGSFSAAAEVLHTVQSNVSEQIRQLERELGVPVLVRGRRGATPTEFGRVVLERARMNRSFGRRTTIAQRAPHSLQLNPSPASRRANPIAGVPRAV